jgi:hypothetical protein
MSSSSPTTTLATTTTTNVDHTSSHSSLLQLIQRDEKMHPNECELVIESKHGRLAVMKSQLQNEDIVQVFARVNVVFIITVSNVYCINFGPYNTFILGVPDELAQKGYQYLLRMDFSQYQPVEIFHCAAGYSAAFFVCKSGRVFFTGQNSSNCIGYENTDMNSKNGVVLFDSKKLNFEKCILVACAAYSTCFVTEVNGNHKLYTCGSNQFGECGTGGISSSSYTIVAPTHVKDWDNFKQRVKKIVCGDHSFVVLTESGRVFVTGYCIHICVCDCVCLLYILQI